MSKESESQAPAGAADQVAADPVLAVLARSVIVPSKTNPRTHFDAVYLQELANSIREHGIIQPLLVRPLPATRLADTFADREPGQPLPTHEIVCGECRWRACALAQADAHVPVLIRHLSDVQVLQIQLVENLKRRDLHPLEEAEGFDRLIKDHGMAIADIAGKIDKSESYIYKALKLLDLTPECREEQYAGKLSQSTALLVARQPAYQQKDVAHAIMNSGFDGEPMSYRAAVRYIRQHFMLELSHAAFDILDADLLPKAGSCATCPKNTSSHGDLFGDAKSDDTCTDPKCFDSKRVAHFAQVAKAAAAKGQKVIQGKEAKELMPSEFSAPKGYKLLDHKEYIDGRTQSVRQAIGKGNVPTPVIIINPHTKEAQEALPVDVANKLLKKGSQAKGDKGKEPTERDLEREYREAWQDATTRQIGTAILAGKMQAMSVDLARQIALYYVPGINGQTTGELLEVGKVGTRSGIEDFIKTCPANKVAPALLMLMVEENFENSYNGKDLKDFPVAQLLAQETGVDVKAIQAQVKADMRAAADARKAAADEKAGKSNKTTPAPALAATKPAGKGKAKKLGATDAKAGISKALQAAAAIKGMEGVTNEVLQALTTASILTLDQLADMTVDELSDITCLTAVDAKAVITKAREHWFDGSAAPANEIEPEIGCRVRIKDGLKNGGREGEAVSYMSTKWHVKFYDAKGTKATRVERADFVVTAGAPAKPLSKVAAWPFPTAAARP